MLFAKDITKPWLKNEGGREKQKRARLIERKLAKAYPDAKIVLRFGNHIQLLAAVILSAQTTDRKVNEVTRRLFKTYKTVDDFADTNQEKFEREIREIGFFRQKARSIITSAQMIRNHFGRRLPRTMPEMLTLRGVARKTANIVLGNAYGIVEGIAVDTHVRRLSQRMGFSAHDDPVKIERDLMVLIPKKRWFVFTYEMVNHGRVVCTARNRKCSLCPLKDVCPSSRESS